MRFFAISFVLLSPSQPQLPIQHLLPIAIKVALAVPPSTQAPEKSDLEQLLSHDPSRGAVAQVFIERPSRGIELPDTQLHLCYPLFACPLMRPFQQGLSNSLLPE